MILSLAPLQGYTEFPFRNALANVIGGVDKYYSPFLRLENDGSLKQKYLKDIAPENNTSLKLIPQILVNNAPDFLKLSHLIQNFGFDEVNWNLGCPYPMVAKRKLGSGLLSSSEIIEGILNEVMAKTKLKISVKFRSGYENSDEIFKVIEVFNNFPLEELIYHPRYGKQLYKGEANVNLFQQVQSTCKHNMAYNGDITSNINLLTLQANTKSINHFMIGRALVANPFLALEIKENKFVLDSEKRKLFEEFHNLLIQHYVKTLSGESHLMNKFVFFWEYFHCQFINGKKLFKDIKKSRSFDMVNEICLKYIRNEAFI